MLERFEGHLRMTVKRAQTIARTGGAATVEAEHLLLALLGDPTVRTASAITRLGLSTEAVRDAIDREFVDALSVVGVSAASLPPPRTTPSSSNPRFGQSAKLALERTLEVAISRGDRRLNDHHLLLAIARAEAGVVPRLLDNLGVTGHSIAAALD